MGIEGRLNLIHPDDRLRLLHFNEKLKAARNGQVLTIEYRISAKIGTFLWIRNRSKVFQRTASGTVTHVLSVLQDMTEEKAADQVLKALNASLEKKNQELETANEEITSFAFVASHDLLEPLRKIHTFSNLLQVKEPHLSPEGKVAVEKLNGSVTRLELLIDDILTLTKVHVDNDRLQPVDLNTLLQQMKEEMQDMLQKKGAVLEADPLPTILGAGNHLLFLLKNLVGNGIKFRAEGVQPHIAVTTGKDDRFFKLTIADNGIGIAPVHHKKIFEMFRRLHSHHEYEGTVMGLAICKKIMEKHGSKITVSTINEQGTAFTCWFPCLY